MTPLMPHGSATCVTVPSVPPLCGFGDATAVCVPRTPPEFPAAVVVPVVDPPVDAPVALCGVVASLGACGSPGLKAGQGRLEVSGRAELTRGARAQTLASGSRLVVRGDRVQILEGSARLVLPGGAELDLRQESVVRVDDSPLLLGGEALATTAGRPLTVELGSAQAAVRSHGAARLSRVGTAQSPLRAVG